jgi:hypothetical protein
MENKESNYYDKDKPRHRPRKIASTTKKRDQKTRPTKRTNKTDHKHDKKTTTKPDHKHGEKRTKKRESKHNQKTKATQAKYMTTKSNRKKTGEWLEASNVFFVVWKIGRVFRLLILRT